MLVFKYGECKYISLLDYYFSWEPTTKLGFNLDDIWVVKLYPLSTMKEKWNFWVDWTGGLKEFKWISKYNYQKQKMSCKLHIN